MYLRCFKLVVVLLSFIKSSLTLLSVSEQYQPSTAFCIFKKDLQISLYVLVILPQLNTNTLQTAHVKCEQAHDNRDHI